MMMMMTMMTEREDLNNVDRTGVILGGVVVRQHGIHVLGGIQTILEGVVAAIGHTRRRLGHTRRYGSSRPR